MRDVTNEEVARCGQKKCKSCRGEGTLRIWVFTDENHQERLRVLCKCAEKAFRKANADKLEPQADGGLKWKDEQVAA